MLNSVTVGNAKLTAADLTNADKVRLKLPIFVDDQLTAADISVYSAVPYDFSYGNARSYSYWRQTHLRQPNTGRMVLAIVRNSSLSP